MTNNDLADYVMAKVDLFPELDSRENIDELAAQYGFSAAADNDASSSLAYLDLDIVTFDLETEDSD